MKDSFGRTLNYLRISVTDRCNLRCSYCMPPEGVSLLPHVHILSYDEITDFARTAVAKGVTKIRITGGEPLVRKGIEKLIAMLASIEGVKDLALTTNGQLLEEKAIGLKAMGLHRVNISLDTLDPKRYTQITRGGDLERVLAGIHAAQAAGLYPIKINCVTGIEAASGADNEQSLCSEANDQEQMRQFARENGLQVRFIRRMSLAQGSFALVEGGSGGDCMQCNRLRLTANGMLKPCLFSNLEYDIRKMGHLAALEAATQNKPPKGGCNPSGSFYAIGG